MKIYTGVCEETAKVFETIGGKRIYPDVKPDQKITADNKQSGYLHLTSPIVGWSKETFFTFTEVVTEPDPPPTDPPSTNKSVVSINISTNPETVTFNYSDGSSVTYPR